MQIELKVVSKEMCKTVKKYGKWQHSSREPDNCSNQLQKLLLLLLLLAEMVTQEGTPLFLLERVAKSCKSILYRGFLIGVTFISALFKNFLKGQ